MTVDTSKIGKRYPALEYEVGREKIREYANAVGEAGPIHHDREQARAEGFRDVVAPPMFCVVYCSGAIAPALFDPEIGIDFARMLHAGQEFAWHEPVCAGDTISTEVSVKEMYEKASNEFYVFESVSSNQDRAEVVRGTWTNIVRGG